MSRQEIQDRVMQYVRDNFPNGLVLASAIDAIVKQAPDDAPAIVAMLAAFSAGVEHGRADGVV